MPIPLSQTIKSDCKDYRQNKQLSINNGSSFNKKAYRKETIITFLSCIMTESLIKYSPYLGFSEGKHRIIPAGRSLPAGKLYDAAEAEGLRTNQKRPSLNLMNAHKLSILTGF
jgi:hypothetical protein